MHVLFVIKTSEETIPLNYPAYQRGMAGHAVRTGFKAGDRSLMNRHSLETYINPSSDLLARYFASPHASSPPLPA